MDSSACCKQQCRLGRSARPLGRAICALPRRRRAFHTKASPANMRLARRGRSFGAGGLHGHSCATPPSRAVICPRPCCFRALPSAGRSQREWSPTSTSGAPSSRRKSTDLGKYAGALRFRPWREYAAAFGRSKTRWPTTDQIYQGYTGVGGTQGTHGVGYTGVGGTQGTHRVG